MTSELLIAIRHCIDCALPFAACALPGSEEYRFYASEATTTLTQVSSSGEQAFVVGFFDPNAEPVAIPARISAHDVLKVTTANAIADDLYPDTTATQYADGAEAIIRRLGQEGGKTVLARVIAMESDRQLTDVIEEYFGIFPHTMRFVYYTPDTGLWLGASPELLLDYDGELCQLHTMSLAGTRAVAVPDVPWDDKNIDEHQYVTDYILAELRRHGLTPEIYDSVPLRFGSIEHLCDRIRAYGRVEAFKIIRSLSPTPALCGYPKQRAYYQILDVEPFNRGCYGGWVAEATTYGVHAYVNLRSSKVAPRACGGWRYNIYAGGGLTAQSKVADEWQETCAKSRVLARIISRGEAPDDNTEPHPCGVR